MNEARKDVERAVIGSVLLAAERVTEVARGAGVRGSSFEDGGYRGVWEAVEALVERGVAVDALTVMDEWRRRAPGASAAVLSDAIESTPTAAHCEHYVRMLAEAAMEGEIRGLCRDVMKRCIEGEVGAAGVFDFLKKGVEGLEGRAYGGNVFEDLHGLADVCEARWRRIGDARRAGDVTGVIEGIPLPWEIMNRIYTGLEEGIHVIAARPSQGKTAMGVNISEFWEERGIKHLFVSIDMAAKQAFMRYGSSSGRVSLSKLNWVGAEKDIAKAGDAMRRIAGRDFLRISSARGLEQMKGVIYEAVRKWGARVVMVDYLQIVKVGRELMHLPKHERVGIVVEELKELSLTLHVPFVVLSQLSREVAKDATRKPRLDDLGDSGTIEREAASVMFLHTDMAVRRWWDEHPSVAEGLAYGQERLAGTLRAVWVVVAKNQQGACGDIPFIMYPHYFIFRPADYEALPHYEISRGKRTREDYPLFMRVRDDWRILDEDDVLLRAGCLGPRQYQGDKRAKTERVPQRVPDEDEGDEVELDFE